jgi:hypothetical protein
MKPPLLALDGSAGSDLALPPGCHGHPPQMELDGTSRNQTGIATWRKGCKSAPHHGFPIPFLQVQSLSRLLVKLAIRLRTADSALIVLPRAKPERVPSIRSRARPLPCPARTCTRWWRLGSYVPERTPASILPTMPAGPIRPLPVACNRRRKRWGTGGRRCDDSSKSLPEASTTTEARALPPLSW